MCVCVCVCVFAYVCSLTAKTVEDGSSNQPQARDNRLQPTSDVYVQCVRYCIACRLRIVTAPADDSLNCSSKIFKT